MSARLLTHEKHEIDHCNVKDGSFGTSFKLKFNAYLLLTVKRIGQSAHFKEIKRYFEIELSILDYF